MKTLLRAVLTPVLVVLVLAVLFRHTAIL